MQRAPTATPATVYAQAFALHRHGRFQDASRLLDAMLARWPDHVDARNLAGVLRMRLGDHPGAIRHLRHARDLGGGAGVLVNLGFAYQASGQPAPAADAYAQALREDPGLAPAWQKLAELRTLQEQPEEALACYRQAIVLDPSDLKSLGQALSLRRDLADWDPAQGPTPDELVSAFRHASRSDYSPGLLLALPEADAALQKQAAATFARSQWQPALSAPPLAPRATDATGRRLRVGYLSTDFRNHAVSFLSLEVIAAHDRELVEVFLYSYGPPTDDAWRRAAIDAADHFADVQPLDDRDAAARIANDRIDVLVDLNGFTRHGRPGILAHRPAPVIAGWIGYIGTMGEPRLADYVIGDAIATPDALAPYFSEAIARMPHCFQPNGRLRASPSTASREAEGLPDGAVVFCSFNQTHKLHPALWDDWCAILRDVPGSVLWLVPPRHASGERNLRAEAARRDVAPDRIVFATKQPRDLHLARLALADIALDTWPYNSGTTASDALRMGVPLLAFPGSTFAGRMATSVLQAAGLPECIARDRADLVALGTALGRDPDRLAALRARLRDRLPHGSLFRPEAFARDLERMLSSMHADARQGRRSPITLEPDRP